MSDSNPRITDVECPSCNSVNPAEKKYCGDCGSLLEGPAGEVKEYLNANLRSHVLSVINEQYKDQKLLESEVAEKVATKLTGWAKLLASFVGIPLGILVITLGLIGIKNYLDFTNLVSNAKKDAERNVEAARKEGEAITSQYQVLRDQLARANGLANDVKLLTAKVDQISEKIDFVPTAALTPDLQRYLESSLAQFRQHLQNIGYKVTETEIKIAVKDNGVTPAYYQKGVINVETAFATDIDVLFREYSHHALLSSGEFQLLDNQIRGLESGLASYFACSFNGDPSWGEHSVVAAAERYGNRQFIEKGSIHNLKNERKFSEISSNPDDTYYIPAEVWGGAFWSLRELFGRDYTDKLLFETWKSLREKDAGNNLQPYFYNRLLETDKALNGNHSNQISQIFSQRGLKS